VSTKRGEDHYPPEQAILEIQDQAHIVGDKNDQSFSAKRRDICRNLSGSLGHQFAR